jgi:hypothetical protein
MEVEAEIPPTVNQETPASIKEALKRVLKTSIEETSRPRTTLRVEKIPLHIPKKAVVKHLRGVVKDALDKEDDVDVELEKGTRHNTLKISGRRDLMTVEVLIRLPVYFIQGNSYRIRHPEIPTPANLGENRVLFALNTPAEESVSHAGSCWPSANFQS